MKIKDEHKEHRAHPFLNQNLLTVLLKWIRWSFLTRANLIWKNYNEIVKHQMKGSAGCKIES